MRIQVPQPWERAMSAQKEALALTTSQIGKILMQHWIDDRQMRYGKGAADPSKAALVFCAQDLMSSEPIFISNDMLDLCRKASESFDRREECREEDFFMPSGFAYLEKPFSTIDKEGKTLTWRAISWRVEEMTFARTDELGSHERIETEIGMGVRIILWSHIDDPDDFTHELKSWMDGQGVKWSWAHATTMRLSDINDIAEISQEGDPVSSWLTFLRVFNRLMAQQIIVSSRYRLPRALRREAARSKLEHISDVLVVELRRKSQKAAHEGTGEPMHYSHQFMVHGHWRNQYYPSEKRHKQKWINAYFKGEGPLVLKDRVWVWDR